MNSYYMHGPVYGIVSDNKDPEKQARVKVALKSLGDSIVTNWIPVLNLYGSSKCGAFFIPEVGDQVIVGFIEDNSERGIVLGGIWSNKQPPPQTAENKGSDLNKDGKNNLRFIKSRSGHKIILDDKDGEEKLQIISSNSATRHEFLVKEKKINIKTDVDLRLSAAGSLGIKAEKGKLSFDKGLKVEVDELSVESKGKNTKLKGSQNITLDGSSVTLN